MNFSGTLAVFFCPGYKMLTTSGKKSKVWVVFLENLRHRKIILRLTDIWIDSSLRDLPFKINVLTFSGTMAAFFCPGYKTLMTSGKKLKSKWF
jgi:hypothetical protein